jgi:hypothetical protein
VCKDGTVRIEGKLYEVDLSLEAAGCMSHAEISIQHNPVCAIVAAAQQLSASIAQ